MAITMYLLLGTSLMCAIGFIDASSKVYTKITSTGGTCTYPGYAPNGFSPDISEITPVEVEKPVSALAEIAGIGGTIAEKAGMVAEKIESLSTLVPALGVVAGAFGKMKDLTEVGTEEIIEKVNEGFVKFAAEINVKLRETKTYVKAAVVTAIAELAKDELEKMQKMWTECVDYPTDKDVKDCMQRTAHYINSAMSHFGKMSDTITYPKGDAPVQQGMRKAPSGGPPTEKLRKIELKVPIFRMYATLRMMVNRVAADMYKKSDAAWYKKFLKDLKKAARESVDYAEWSSYWIEYKNCPQYYTPEPLCSPNQDDTYESGFWFMKKEHISGTYKYCGAVINPFVRTDTCHFKMYVQRPQRPDKYLSAVDKGGSGWTHTACPYTRPSESRMSTVEFEKKDMAVVLHCLGTIADQKWKKMYTDFVTTNCKVATAYVKRELTNIIGVWKKVLSNAEKELNDLKKTHGDVPDIEDDPTLPVAQIEEESDDELPDEVNDDAMFVELDDESNEELQDATFLPLADQMDAPSYAGMIEGDDYGYVHPRFNGNRFYDERRDERSYLYDNYIDDDNIVPW